MHTSGNFKIRFAFCGFALWGMACALSSRLPRQWAPIITIIIKSIEFPCASVAVNHVLAMLGRPSRPQIPWIAKQRQQAKPCVTVAIMKAMLKFNSGKNQTSGMP